MHLHKYRMQSKVILCTTAVLLIVPAMYFYFFEFADLTRKERLLSSLFQAVTPRTAGFNTVELTDLSELIVPAMYFYFFEFADLTRKERLLSSLFQAVTPRTAGFNTVELTDLSEAGQFITIALMLIGGSPGSTAGGLKTTTIAVLLTTAISTFRRRENAVRPDNLSPLR